MRSSRITWLLLTLAAAAAYLFENQTGTRILLLSLLLLPLVSMAVLRLSRGEVGLRMEHPPALERGTTGTLVLRFDNAKIVPVTVRGEFFLRNRMTGAVEKVPVSVQIPGRGTANTAFALSTPHCGTVELSVRNLRTVGLFGLDAKKLPLNQLETTTVLPILRPVEVRFAETADFLSDSQRYSASRPGYDPSETFRIREYVPGDPVRQIHWKLSEKLDQLQVRDFGLPVVERMLLLMENGVQPGFQPDPDHTDRLLDLLSSVSAALALNGTSHVLGWQEAESGAYVSREIHQPEDLQTALAELLWEPISEREDTVCGCFSRSHTHCAFAHVAVFSDRVSPDLNLLFHGNRVTVLLPADAAADQEAWAQNAELITFTDETTELEL